MSPPVAVDLLTVGLVENIQFLSVYWPTVGNLEIWEHDANGDYVETLVDITSPAFISGSGGSNGLNASRYNSMQIVNTPTDGLMLVAHTAAWDQLPSGSLVFVRISDGAVVTRPISNSNLRDRMTIPRQNPDDGGFPAGPSDDIWYMTTSIAFNVGEGIWEFTTDAWKSSFNDPESLEVDDITTSTGAVAMPPVLSAMIAPGRFATQYFETDMDGSISSQEDGFVGDGGHVYAGTDLSVGYKFGNMVGDRFLREVDFDNLTEGDISTVVGDIPPSAFSVYNVSSNLLFNTCCMYVWKDLDPPKAKIFTAGSTATQDEPMIEVGKNGSKVADAFFIVNYEQ